MSVVEVTPDLLKAWPLPPLPSGSDKETRGRVLVVAGGPDNPGGAMLAGLAALRAGAGKLQLTAEGSMAEVLAISLMEARVIRTPAPAGGAAATDIIVQRAERVGAVVLGPGMSDETVAARVVEALAIIPEIHLVLDAAALTGLRAIQSGVAAIAGRLVLTPHAGEMARLLDVEKKEVDADPLAAARAAARTFQAVVAMKGETTHIVSPDGRTWRHCNGVVGLGTSGSGDVLAGVIGGLLARGAPPAQAATWGVALHASAGQALSSKIGSLGFLAREILAEIPAALDRLSGVRPGTGFPGN